VTSDLVEAADRANDTFPTVPIGRNGVAAIGGGARAGGLNLFVP
jgi:hypothetical protein